MEGQRRTATSHLTVTGDRVSFSSLFTPLPHSFTPRMCQRSSLCRLGTSPGVPPNQAARLIQVGAKNQEHLASALPRSFLSTLQIGTPLSFMSFLTAPRPSCRLRSRTVSVAPFSASQCLGWDTYHHDRHVSKYTNSYAYYKSGDRVSIQGKKYLLLNKISDRWVQDLIPTLRSPAGSLKSQYVSTHFCKNITTGTPGILRTMQQTRSPAFNHEGTWAPHETNSVHDVTSYIALQRGQHNSRDNTLHIVHHSSPGLSKPFKNSPVQGPKLQMPGGYIHHVVFSTLHHKDLVTWRDIGIEELERDPKYAIGLLNLYK